MADDLNRKLQDELEGLAQRVQALERWNPLESASVTGGRLRFIGGTLRVDSGGQVEVIGEWRFFGPGAITGDVVAEGKWTQNGLWEFNGDGDIDGDVDITGILSLLGGGSIKAGNIEITPSANGGTIKVGAHSIYVNGAAFTLLHSSGSQVVLNDGGATLLGGGRTLSAQSTGVGASGLSTIDSAAAGGLPSGAIWTNGSELFRVA